MRSLVHQFLLGVALLVLVALPVCSPAWAQGEETPATTTDPTVPEDPAPPSDTAGADSSLETPDDVAVPVAPGSAEGENAATDPLAAMQRVIYLPFKNILTVFEKPGSVVVLPYTEYQQLRKQAEAKSGQAPAVAAAITESRYVATIEKDLARIKVELKVNVLGEPWVELPIRFGAAAVGKFDGGEKTILQGAGDGAYKLLLGEAGERTVTLELETRVHSSPEGRSFEFECPPVGITTFEVSIPEAGQSIDVTPNVVVLPAEAGMNETRFKASLGATGRIAARWYPKASIKPEMDLLTRVTNRSLVAIEDGLIHTDAYLSVEILRGSLDQFNVAVPKGVRVLDVSSNAKLKGWQVKDEENRQVVAVELLSGQEGSLQLEVHTEQKLPDDAFAIGGLTEAGAAFGVHALDVANETGQIVVRNSPELTLSIVDQQGVTRIDINEADERIRAAGGSGFKYYNPRFSLRAAVKPVEPRLLLDQRTSLSFLDDELRVQSELTYTVDKAGVFQLVVKLPEKVMVDRVECPQMKDFNVDEANRLLTVSLLEKTQGAIGVVVQSHLPYAAGKEAGEIILPVLEPVGTERETGWIGVYAREAIEVITNEKGIVSAQPSPIQSRTQAGDLLVNSEWTYTRRPVTIPVTTGRKPTRISANVATKLDVQPESTRVESLVDFSVEYAGIDEFRFQVPENAGDAVQIRAISLDTAAPAIKQKSKGDPVDGWVTWTIVMQREVTGQQRFEVTYDLKPAAAAEASAPKRVAGEAKAAPASRSILARMIRPLGHEKGDQKTALNESTGEMTVLKEESLSVSGEATGGDVEQIDVRELEHLPQTGTLAYRYFDQPADGAIEVKVSQTRFEIQKVVATVVSKALVEVVLGEGADATYRARYRLKTSERQRLLVHLPVGLQILGAFINDREVKLEKADSDKLGQSWESFWLNVVRTGQADEEFLVTFHFQWAVHPALGDSTYGRGTLELPLPGFGRKDENIPVQQLRVAVHVPKEFRVVGDPDRFTQQPRALALWHSLFFNPWKVDCSSLQGWIGGGAVAALPTEGREAYLFENLGGANIITLTWWHRVRMSVLFSLAVAALALVLLRTSWENKLGVLLCGALALALFGLSDESAASATLQSMRFGLLFLAGIWVLHTVLGWRCLLLPAAVDSNPIIIEDATPTSTAPVVVTAPGASPSAESTPDTPPPPPQGTP